MSLQYLLYFTILSVPDFHMFVCEGNSRQLSFADLRDKEFFVDKTLLIQDFLYGKGPQQMIMKTKRGFGKTINLDMIRRFLEIDVFPNGTKQTDKFSYKNYKMFSTRVPSTGRYLDVFRERPLFEKNFGEYPVIWLDLDTKGVKTYDESGLISQLLNSTIRLAFMDHAYLINSSMITAEDKALVRRFLFPNCSMHDVTPLQGIILLKKLLRQHFQRDVITLADNVDAHLREVIFDPKQDIEMKLDVLDILTDKSESSSRTLMTCVLLPPRGLQLNYWFGKRYEGVSECMLNTLVYKKPSLLRRMPQIKAWYGGYGNKFNLYSTIQYLTRGRKTFLPYWIELGSLDTFKMAFASDCYGPKIIECFAGCEITPANFSSHLEVFSEAMQSLKNLQRLASPIDTSVCSNELFLHFIRFLEDLGYLSHMGTVYRPRDSPLKEYRKFKIPNLEVRDYITRLLYEAVVKEASLNGIENFRLELFEAIFAVNESEPSVRRFATTIIAMQLASERGLQQASNATLAHVIRVHLLHPPPLFTVLYVKTTRSDGELDSRLSDFDLVFAVKSKGGPTLGFVLKIEFYDELTTSSKIFGNKDDYFPLEELRSVTDNSTVNTVMMLAELVCTKNICRFSYLYNGTQTDQFKQLEIKKDQIRKKVREQWRSSEDNLSN